MSKAKPLKLCARAMLPRDASNFLRETAAEIDKGEFVAIAVAVVRRNGAVRSYNESIDGNKSLTLLGAVRLLEKDVIEDQFVPIVPM